LSRGAEANVNAFNVKASSGSERGKIKMDRKKDFQRQFGNAKRSKGSNVD